VYIERGDPYAGGSRGYSSSEGRSGAGRGGKA
jgi:hypothetical protein